MKCTKLTAKLATQVQIIVLLFLVRSIYLVYFIHPCMNPLPDFLHAKRSILFSNVFIKQIFFTIGLSTLIFLLYFDCRWLKAIARQIKNSFFFGKLLFLILTSSNSKGSYAIALKFSAKQIDLITKKSVCVICKIMNINADSRIFMNAGHSLFLKKH